MQVPGCRACPQPWRAVAASSCPHHSPCFFTCWPSPHKTPCASHPLPGWGFPCLSGKVSVSSSLENYQVPAAAWEEGELALKSRARALRTVGCVHLRFRGALEDPASSPPRLPPRLPLAAWPSLGRLPQPPDPVHSPEFASWGSSGTKSRLRPLGEVLEAPVESHLAPTFRGAAFKT